MVARINEHISKLHRNMIRKMRKVPPICAVEAEIPVGPEFCIGHVSITHSCHHIVGVPLMTCHLVRHSASFIVFLAFLTITSQVSALEAPDGDVLLTVTGKAALVAE